MCFFIDDGRTSTLPKGVLTEHRDTVAWQALPSIPLKSVPSPLQVGEEKEAHIELTRRRWRDNRSYDTALFLINQCFEPQT